MIRFLLLSTFLFTSNSVAAQSVLPILSATQSATGGTEYSVTLQLLGLMTVLTLLPSVLLMATSFTRIIIVLSLLRQALGTGTTPPNQVLLGVALFLTIFIMEPTFSKVYEEAIVPYSNNEIPLEDAIQNATIPMKEFMLAQTRERDLESFVGMSDQPVAINEPLDTPLTILMPAFITSELKSAFTIGFMLYIPFIVIDMVVASVLMSMGMMMLSPIIISLPFKLLIFVMVDGWALLMTSLTRSYI